MTQAGYRIEPDLANRLVRMTLYGFWDDATLTRYQESLRKLAEAAEQMGPSAGGFRVFIDLREHDLLTKDHAIRLQDSLDKIGGAHRTAIVMTHLGLLKRQVERIGSTLRPKFFTSEKEALDWLLAEPAAG